MFLFNFLWKSRGDSVIVLRATVKGQLYIDKILVDIHYILCYTSTVSEFCAISLRGVGRRSHVWSDPPAHVVRFVRFCQWDCCAMRRATADFLFYGDTVPMVAGMTSVCCMADALGFARIVVPAFLRPNAERL